MHERRRSGYAFPKDRAMSDNSKQWELMTPTRAARLLGVARNTVMHRVASHRYQSERIGGVTFVVRTAQLEADIAARGAERVA